MIGLFLDDERNPPPSSTIEWVVVRSFKEAVDYVEEHGCPSLISFDNYLGIGCLEGWNFAEWLVSHAQAELIAIPDDFRFRTHSSSQEMRFRINKIMNNYLRSRTPLTPSA